MRERRHVWRVILPSFIAFSLSLLSFAALAEESITNEEIGAEPDGDGSSAAPEEELDEREGVPASAEGSASPEADLSGAGEETDVHSQDSVEAESSTGDGEIQSQEPSDRAWNVWYQSDRNVVRAGWVIAGSFYLGAVLWGSLHIAYVSALGGLLYIPVLGPFIYGVWWFSEAGQMEDGLGRGLAIGAGICTLLMFLTQSLGVLLLAVGYRRHVRRNRERSQWERSRSGASVAPVGPDGPGVMVVGWF